MAPSKSLILVKHPNGFPIPGEDLVVKESEFDLDAPLEDGSVLVKVLYLSYDPYQRGRMRDSKSYIAGYTLGQPISNFALMHVLKSSNPHLKPNDAVLGMGLFTNYQIFSKDAVNKPAHEGGLQKLENPLGLDEKIFLGALGMSGLTAYSSLYEIGKPKKGETIFISAASGAVGAIVGQLAKREGLRVLGSVGSDEKLKFITEELGFDGGFNYKKESPKEGLLRVISETGGGGLHIYYDNVGGEQLDATLEVLDNFGRVVLCGSVSQTSLPAEQRYGMKNIPLVVGKRLTLRGFLCFDADFGPKYAVEHQKNMQKWIKEGEVVVKMDVTEGIEMAAEGLVGMLKGENFGKAVLRV